MEPHANRLITNDQIDSTYQREHDVILCKLDLNPVPLTQDLGFTGVSPGTLCAQVADSKRKTLHGLISQQEIGFAPRHCICDSVNI